MAQDSDNPIVIIDTSMGTITAELWADRAPETVANMLAYIDDEFFDGTSFLYKDVGIAGIATKLQGGLVVIKDKVSLFILPYSPSTCTNTEYDHQIKIKSILLIQYCCFVFHDAGKLSLRMHWDP